MKKDKNINRFGFRKPLSTLKNTLKNTTNDINIINNDIKKRKLDIVHNEQNKENKVHNISTINNNKKKLCLSIQDHSIKQDEINKLSNVHTTEININHDIITNKNDKIESVSTTVNNDNITIEFDNITELINDSLPNEFLLNCKDVLNMRIKKIVLIIKNV